MGLGRGRKGPAPQGGEKLLQCSGADQARVGGAQGHAGEGTSVTSGYDLSRPSQGLIPSSVVEVGSPQPLPGTGRWGGYENLPQRFSQPSGRAP